MYPHEEAAQSARCQQRWVVSKRRCQLKPNLLLSDMPSITFGLGEMSVTSARRLRASYPDLESTDWAIISYSQVPPRRHCWPRITTRLYVAQGRLLPGGRVCPNAARATASAGKEGGMRGAKHIMRLRRLHHHDTEAWAFVSPAQNSSTLMHTTQTGLDQIRTMWNTTRQIDTI